MRLWQRIGHGAYILAWPLLWVYLRTGVRTRVLIIAGDSVLLVRGWLSDEKWGLPGGGIHRHEPVAEGAVREVLEETGIQLTTAELIPLADEWRDRNGLKFYCHFFAVRLKQQQTPRRQRGEILAVEWLPLAELKRLPHKAEIDRALELLAAHR